MMLIAYTRNQTAAFFLWLHSLFFPRITRRAYLHNSIPLDTIPMTLVESGDSCIPPTPADSSGSYSVSAPLIPASIIHAPDTRPRSPTRSLLPADICPNPRVAAEHSLPSKRARKPRAGNELLPSIHRPHVPADRRVLLWTSPHSFALHDRLSVANIGSDLQAKIFEGLLRATTEATRETYGAGILRFHQFCDRNSIGERARMPADRVLLSAFIAESLGTCSGKCIRNWVNGLRLWHIFNDAEWHGDEGWVPSLKKAGDRAGVPFKRPPRGAITKHHLRAVRAGLDLSTGFGAAVWSCTTALFWGCRRAGELTIKSVNKFDPQHDTCRETRTSSTKVRGHDVINFHIVWTKTTTILGGECVLTQVLGEDADLCPTWAFLNHITINDAAPPLTPIFAFREHSLWRPLTKDHFLRTTTALHTSAGLETVFGHSYRIGGSVELLLAGVEPEMIMKLGGWTSLCFLIYWRRLEQILPARIIAAWDSKIKQFASRHGHPASSLLIGSLLNFFSFGTLLAQTYIYHVCFSRDGWLIKSIVYFIIFAITLDCCLNTVDVWFWYVTSFGDLRGFTDPRFATFYSPIMGSFIAMVVHLFFCFRIFVIRRTIWPVCILIAVISLGQFIGGLGSGALAYFEEFKIHSFSANDLVSLGNQDSHADLIYLWLVCGPAADVLIAITMTILILKTAVHSATRDIAKDIVRLILETNTFSAFVGLFNIFLFAGFPSTTYCSCPGLVIPGIYANTLLVTLNNRAIMQRNRTDERYLDDVEMPPEVSNAETASIGESIGSITFAEPEVLRVPNSSPGFPGSASVINSLTTHHPLNLIMSASALRARRTSISPSVAEMQQTAAPSPTPNVGLFGQLPSPTDLYYHLLPRLALAYEKQRQQRRRTPPMCPPMERDALL
ncbi:hypothetical protein C8R45DRAFT_1212931 [Mycena sanguinolenta]|nr:hypothetical protein C8R45DRAFT_1212931 [Mycena sanguinolenta]